MSKRRQDGFTLIEAAVAIAVVAILSGIIVPLVVKNFRDAQLARGRNDVQVIAAAVASMLKDTGSRPTAANGPGGCTGAGNAAWASGLDAQNPINGNAPANNLFTNLFTTNPTGVASDPANTLFYGAAASANITAASEFRYRGPYLSADVALKSDPWGRGYLIMGFNANGQTNNLPIYIVSAGPDNTILAANWNGGSGPAAGWSFTSAAVNGPGSQDDIVVRVN